MTPLKSPRCGHVHLWIQVSGLIHWQIKGGANCSCPTPDPMSIIFRAFSKKDKHLTNKRVAPHPWHWRLRPFLEDSESATAEFTTQVSFCN